MMSSAFTEIGEPILRLLAFPKSSYNTLVASTPPWLKIATQITKTIKRVLVFLKFILVFWVKISGVGTKKWFCIL